MITFDEAHNFKNKQMNNNKSTYYKTIFIKNK